MDLIGPSIKCIVLIEQDKIMYINIFIFICLNLWLKI